MIPRTGAPTTMICQKRKRGCSSTLNSSSSSRIIKGHCHRRRHYFLGDWSNTGMDRIRKKLPSSSDTTPLTSGGVCSLWRYISQKSHAGHDYWLLDFAATAGGNHLYLPPILQIKRLLHYNSSSSHSRFHEDNNEQEEEEESKLCLLHPTKLSTFAAVRTPPPPPPLPTPPPIQKALVLSDSISNPSRKRKQGRCLSLPNSNSKRLRRRRQYFRDWSNMGIDVLEGIHKRLPLSDTLTSRALCSLWRSVAQNHIPPSLHSPSPPPPLLLWEQYHHAGSDYWLLDAAATDGGNLYVPNPETKRLLHSSICVGSSSHGYLLFDDNVEGEEECRLCLLHPLVLSPFAVRIPPLPTGIDGIQKALVLSDPISDTTSSSSSSSGFVVLGYDEKLWFAAKCGGAPACQFVQLEGQDRKRTRQRTDMICINNCIYAINASSSSHHFIQAWDCSSSSSSSPRKVLDFVPTFSSEQGLTRRSTLHLVESLGQLLLVAISRPDQESDVLHHGVPPNSVGKYQVCMVYRMDFKEKKWVLMDSLGDRVLFIMEYQTMSLSAKQFPQYQSNSIYFRHYFSMYNINLNRYSWPDKTTLAIFNMEDGSLKHVKTTTTVT